MAKMSASHKVRNGDVGFAQSARRDVGFAQSARHAQMSASHKVRSIHNKTKTEGMKARQRIITRKSGARTTTPQQHRQSWYQKSNGLRCAPGWATNAVRVASGKSKTISRFRAVFMAGLVLPAGRECQKTSLICDRNSLCESRLGGSTRAPASKSAELQQARALGTSPLVRSRHFIRTIGGWGVEG